MLPFLVRSLVVGHVAGSQVSTDEGPTGGPNFHGRPERELAARGRNQRRHEFPALVNVRTGLGGLCSGTLLSSRHVVTARHCVQDKETFEWNIFPGDGSTITLNDWNLKTDRDGEMVVPFSLYGVKMLPRKGKLKHWEYNPSLWAHGWHDVAVIELQWPIRWANGREPVGRVAKRLLVGDKLTLAGWGYINVEDKMIGTTYAQVIDMKAKRGIYGHNVEYEGDNKRPCQGDSGSGVYSYNEKTMDRELAAVHSFSRGKCDGDLDAPYRSNVATGEGVTARTVRKWLNKLRNQQARCVVHRDCYGKFSIKKTRCTELRPWVCDRCKFVLKPIWSNKHQRCVGRAGPCKDMHTNCHYWKENGLCRRGNHSEIRYMHSNCRASCGLCNVFADIGKLEN